MEDATALSSKNSPKSYLSSPKTLKNQPQHPVSVPFLLNTHCLGSVQRKLSIYNLGMQPSKSCNRNFNKSLEGWSLSNISWTYSNSTMCFFRVAENLTKIWDLIALKGRSKKKRKGLNFLSKDNCSYNRSYISLKSNIRILKTIKKQESCNDSYFGWFVGRRFTTRTKKTGPMTKSWKMFWSQCPRKEISIWVSQLIDFYAISFLGWLMLTEVYIISGIFGLRLKAKTLGITWVVVVWPTI